MLIEYGCGLTHVLSNTDALPSIKIDNFIEPCRGTRKKSPARFYEVTTPECRCVPSLNSLRAETSFETVRKLEIEIEIEIENKSYLSLTFYHSGMLKNNKLPRKRFKAVGTRGFYFPAKLQNHKCIW